GIMVGQSDSGRIRYMRVKVIAFVRMLLAAPPLFAQDWTEYENREDRFSVPGPGQPKIETIVWDSEYGAKFPGHVYRWSQGPNQYSVTVVDYNDAEKIHAALNN